MNRTGSTFRSRNNPRARERSHAGRNNPWPALDTPFSNSHPSLASKLLNLAEHTLQIVRVKKNLARRATRGKVCGHRAGVVGEPSQTLKRVEMGVLDCGHLACPVPILMLELRSASSQRSFADAAPPAPASSVKLDAGAEPFARSPPFAKMATATGGMFRYAPVAPPHAILAWNRPR